MKKCNYCNASFDDNEKFCPECGYAAKDQTVETKKQDSNKIYQNEEAVKRDSNLNNLYSYRTAKFVQDTLAKTKLPFSPSCRKFVYFFSLFLFYFMLAEIILNFISFNDYALRMFNLLQNYNFLNFLNITITEELAVSLLYLKICYLFLSIVYYYHLSKRAFIPYKMNLFFVIVALFFNPIIFGVLLYEYIKYN